MTLPVEAFGGYAAARDLVLAQVYALRHVRPVRCGGPRRRPSGGSLNSRRRTPDDVQLHVLRGLALAYLGRRDEAIGEGERGVASMPISREAYIGPYFQHQLVRIYMVLGETEKALDALEPLLEIPYFLSPGWLWIDPNFAPLRGNPRFEKLLRP